MLVLPELIATAAVMLEYRIKEEAWATLIRFSLTPDTGNLGWSNKSWSQREEEDESNQSAKVRPYFDTVSP